MAREVGERWVPKSRHRHIDQTPQSAAAGLITWLGTANLRLDTPENESQRKGGTRGGFQAPQFLPTSGHARTQDANSPVGRRRKGRTPCTLPPASFLPYTFQFLRPASCLAAVTAQPPNTPRLSTTGYSCTCCTCCTCPCSIHTLHRGPLWIVSRETGRLAMHA